jgi:transposase
MRKPGPPAEWERLRKRAVQAVREGQPPSVVAKVLGVHRVTVQRWLRQARAPGGLDARPVVRTPLPADEQLPRLEALLREGASKHGWPDHLWTAARVAALIQRHFGVTHHPEHVRKVPERRLGRGSQRPHVKAKEKNDEGLRLWLAHDSPRVVAEAFARCARLVFLDESGSQLTPAVRRTLAPRGRTPVLPCWDRRDRLSAIGCVTVSPLDRVPDLYFRLLPDNADVHAEDVADFLKGLKRSLPRFTVVWDRNGTHGRSRAVQAFLRGQRHIRAAGFPGYAPELNPDELVWCWTKYSRLANYAAPGLGALRERVQAELTDLKGQDDTLRNFIDHAGLSLAAWM